MPVTHWCRKTNVGCQQRCFACFSLFCYRCCCYPFVAPMPLLLPFCCSHSAVVTLLLLPFCCCYPFVAPILLLLPFCCSHSAVVTLLLLPCRCCYPFVAPMLLLLPFCCSHAAVVTLLLLPCCCCYPFVAPMPLLLYSTLQLDCLCVEKFALLLLLCT